MTGLSLVLFGVVMFFIGMYTPRVLNRLFEIIFCYRCDGRFSLCLDCELHNGCRRYSKHLKEIHKEGASCGLCNGD